MNKYITLIVEFFFSFYGFALLLLQVALQDYSRVNYFHPFIDSNITEFCFLMILEYDLNQQFLVTAETMSL